MEEKEIIFNREAINNIQTNQTIVYYKGNLATDCLRTNPKSEINLLRVAALNAYYADKAVLYQKKISTALYQYIAKGK